MDNSNLVERAQAVCEYCIDILEEKLDAMDVTLSSSDIDSIIENVMFVVEDNITSEM